MVDNSYVFGVRSLPWTMGVYMSVEPIIGRVMSLLSNDSPSWRLGCRERKSRSGCDIVSARAIRVSGHPQPHRNNGEVYLDVGLHPKHEAPGGYYRLRKLLGRRLAWAMSGTASVLVGEGGEGWTGRALAQDGEVAERGCWARSGLAGQAAATRP